MLRVVFIFLVFSHSVSLLADMADTVIALEAVVSRGIKFERIHAGSRMIEADSLQLAHYQNTFLSDLLANMSIVQVSSYGAGGVASLKIRGGNSDQTSFIWNGLNIKPPMSGDQNLSNIHTGIFDRLVVQPGPSSARHGTGAATGVVYLSNSLSYDTLGLKVDIDAEYGSFETKNLFASAQWTSRHLASQIKAGYLSSANNITFTNNDRYGKPLDTLEHAAYQTFSLLQHNSIKPFSSVEIETDLWYTHHFKEIPSLTSDMLPGQNEQTDENLHLALHVAKYGNNWYVRYRGGLLYYSIDYLMHLNGQSSTSLSQSLTTINEMEARLTLSANQALYLGLNHTLDRAEVTNYSSDPKRSQFDVFGSYRISLFDSKLLMNLEARQAFTGGNAVPLVYSYGAEYLLINGLSLKATASKLYNLPDLNDLYWAPTAYAAGNPHLEPEHGWSAEAGLRYEKKMQVFAHTHELSYYVNELSDAIIWAEDSNRVWVPDNYANSRTTGVEYAGTLSWHFYRSVLQLGGDYAYTQARLLESSGMGQDYIPKLYIPAHKLGMRIQWVIGGFSTALYGQVSGERPTDNNSGVLDPYVLADLHTGYRFSLSHADIALHLKVKNLLNTNYQLRPGYAQALRGIYFGINITF